MSDDIDDDAYGDDFSADAERELNELATVELRAEGAAALLVRTGSRARAILCSPCAPPSKRRMPCARHQAMGW